MRGSGMEIVRVDMGTVTVPLAGVFTTAHSARTSQGAVVVRVSADSGVAGWGSVEPTRGYSTTSIAQVAAAVRDSLAPALLHQDPLNPAHAHEVMRQCCDIPEARAVLEMALFDLAGRALDVPAWRLLGGAVRDKVRLNGWIGLVAPELAGPEASEWIRRGFTSLKVKVGHDLAADVDRVAAIRAAGGQLLEIRVDANEGLDVEESVRLAHALEPYDVAVFEQPVARYDIEGLAIVRRKCRIPIMADESVQSAATVIDLIRHEAADLIKVKVMKQGGLLPTLETAQVAAAAGMRVVIGHGFGLWLSTMSELHVAACCRAIIDGAECVGPLKMPQDVVAAPPAIADGSVALPARPGLGVEPEPDLLEKFGWMPVTVGV